MEEAVKKAGQEWNSTYADKLEKLLAKRAITVNLGFSTKNLNNLDDVKRRLAELKIEPLTPENKTAIKDLVRELKELAKAMEKVQKYSKIQTPELQQALANKANAEAAHMAEKYRQANERLEVSKRRVALAEQKHAEALSNTSKKINEQHSYVSRLIKRMAIYASFSYAANFLTSIREVTAQFELQRISLGAIIQDQAKANALFSEIKNFALKSPIKILDLTKYTKQLAAYKIGVNELFDTTKRLADISIGIGTSMDRLILLYGQVRATGYLRASEVRQATEAGIPLVEELAAKLSEANGTLVTSAQVLKMVEERAISFEMVKEVFEDMTNAGGLFYDMQEKQGNTLYGMWQKLGDAAAMMYDEIGNTPWVNEGMKEAINMLRTLMIEWKQVGANIATLGVAILLYANKTKLATLATKLNTAANTEGSTALRGRILHLKKAIMYQNLFATSTTTATTATKLFTLAQLRLTQALNLVVVGFKKLSAAFMSNIWGIVLVGVSLVVERLLLAKDAAKELKNELANINLDYESKQGQDAANLEYLANAAVNAAKGSKAQKDALEELKNTYGKIIPMELLTIENLERMKGNYGELIALIDEYNLKQKYEKETSAIESSFAPKEEERANKIRNILRDGLRLDYADEATGGVFDKVLDLSERNIQRFLLNLKKYADEGLDKKEQIIRASADLAAELGLNEGETEALTNAMIDLDRHELEGQGTLMDYTEALHQKHEAMEEVTNDYEKQKKALNEYSAVVDEVLKKNEEEPEVTANKDEFENEKARLNNQISDVASGIVELLNKANVAVDNGTQQILNTVIQNGGMIPDAVWDILEKAAEAANNPKLLAAIQDLREHYKGLAPDNQTVNFIKDRMAQIVSHMGLKMKEFRQYLWDGQGDIKTYQENLQKSINTLRAQAFEMIKLNALIDAGLAKGQKYDVKEIQTLQAKADALQQLLDTSVTPLVMPDEKKSKSRGGTKSDNRLQNLQEIEQTLTKINQKYDELAKKEGQTKALEDINKLYANTLDYLNKLGKQFKLSFKIPTEFKDLQDYRKAILDVINTLKMKGYQKAALDLEEKIGTGNLDALQKDIEKQLKELSDRISRTKTAKEFYEKILGMTGDYDLAAKVSLSIYGDTGYDLQKQLAEQIKEMTGGYGVEVPISIISADNRIDYLALERFIKSKQKELGGIESNAYKELVKIAQDGQKDLAKTYEGYLKDLEKAKTYSDKRIELARYTANKIAEIEASALPKEEKERLTAGYKEREKQKQGELEWEAFKDMPMYVQMFDDLDNASETMLSNMKSKLTELQSVWGSTMNPTQLKELQSRLNDIDAQLAKKNPFKTLSDAMKQYKALSKGGTQADAERKLIEATDKRQAAQQKLNMALDVSRTAQERYNEAVAKYGNGSEQAKSAKIFWDAAKQGVDNAGKLVEQTGLSKQEAQRLVNVWKKVKGAIRLSLGEVFQIAHSLSDLAGGIGKLTEVFGGSEEDVQYWNDIASSLNEVTSGIENMVKAALSGNPIGIVTSAVTAIPNMISGFAGLFSAGKVRKANKEIKRQQELLEQLEYTYGRLEKAADSLFGADYISNYKQQIKNLQAQQTAYLRMAEAERSKGKDEDAAKTQEYLNIAREIGDRIADMQKNLAAQLLGNDLGSAARDFASAWLDAYKEFDSTTDAMSKKFKEMVEQMVANSVIAQVMKKALEPTFEMINKMQEGDFYSERFWERVVKEAERGAEAGAHGAEVIAQMLENAGVNLRESGSEYTGIAKDVAGASSEEVLQLSGFVNTALYYISPIPRMDENLARVVEMMERGGASASTPLNVTEAGWTDWQQQAMDSYIAIQRNTADTVVECRRAAEACERIASTFKVKGSTKGLNVFLNS